jgi:hypothetical protein
MTWIWDRKEEREARAEQVGPAEQAGRAAQAEREARAERVEWPALRGGLRASARRS